VVAALTAAVVCSRVRVIETRSRHALLPVRLLRSRDRLGANLIMLAWHRRLRRVLLRHLFVQEYGVLPLRTGVAFLPLTAAMLAASGAAPRSCADRRTSLLLAGGAPVRGLYWLSG